MSFSLSVDTTQLQFADWLHLLVWACVFMIVFRLSLFFARRLQPKLAAKLAASEATQRFLVWSRYHSAWWRPQGAGYTSDAADAGRYTFAEAQACCRARSRNDGAPAPEIMVVDDPQAIRAAKACCFTEIDPLTAAALLKEAH